MKKYLFLVYIVFLLFLASKISHVEAVSSATKDDSRITKLHQILTKNNSPLIPHAETIVNTSDKYGIPWTIVASIAGVESGFCKFIPKNSYNCWGWNNGKTKFRDYPDAIEVVSKTLRFSYFDKGLNTPEKIQRIYAPPSPSWGQKIRYFTNILEK